MVLRKSNVYNASAQAAADIVVVDNGPIQEYHALELKCRLLNEAA